MTPQELLDRGREILDPVPYPLWAWGEAIKVGGARSAMEYHNHVTISFGAPITLWIEPWGEDYTLIPHETVQVVAESCSDEFYLHWHLEEGKIIIYAEGDQGATVSVYQEGNLLECGHHRGVDTTPVPLGPGTLIPPE